jgi:hypothetical protein
MEIVVLYNGNINLPKERNHKTKFGYHQCSKKFKNVDDAACFIIECDFYSGSITTLEEIIPNGFKDPNTGVITDCIRLHWYRPDGIYYETNYKSYNLTKLYKKGEEVMDSLERMCDDAELDIHRRQIREVMKDLIYTLK